MPLFANENFAALSIAKSGWVRDITKEAGTVVRGVNKTITNIGIDKADRFAEGISEGSANVFDKKLQSIEGDPVRNAMSGIFGGVGQLGAQIALSGGVSGVLGAGGKMILGRAGQAALAGDLALADIGAVNLIGKSMLKSKDAIATFITVGAQSFDSNLKTAMGYTSDNGTATAIATGMSMLEAGTEGILSPLDIARGIGKKLINKKEMRHFIDNVPTEIIIPMLIEGAKIEDYIKAIEENGNFESVRNLIPYISEEGKKYLPLRGSGKMRVAKEKYSRKQV